MNPHYKRKRRRLLIVLTKLDLLSHLPSVYLEDKPQRGHLVVDFEIEPVDVVAGYCGKHDSMIAILFDPVLVAFDHHRCSPAADARTASRSNKNARSSPGIKDSSFLVQINSFQIVEFSAFGNDRAGEFSVGPFCSPSHEPFVAFAPDVVTDVDPVRKGWSAIEPIGLGKYGRTRTLAITQSEKSLPLLVGIRKVPPENPAWLRC